MTAQATARTAPGLTLVDTPAGWPGAAAGRAHIAVLDSSFNPPTLAHLAIARSLFPHTAGTSAAEIPPYTARLLLYSPRNADKTPGAGDAGTAVRLAMMAATARALDADADAAAAPVGPVRTAVALLPHPTFAAKAAALSSLPGRPHLTFLVGSDTLARIFDARYYDDMESALGELFARATLVSVDRGEDVLRIPGVQAWVEKGAVRVVRVHEAEGVSSSNVRAAVGRGESVRGLVLSEVEEVIVREGLYRQ